jgi:hypothetical protein
MVWNKFLITLNLLFWDYTMSFQFRVQMCVYTNTNRVVEIFIAITNKHNQDDSRFSRVVAVFRQCQAHMFVIL